MLFKHKHLLGFVIPNRSAKQWGGGYGSIKIKLSLLVNTCIMLVFLNNYIFFPRPCKPPWYPTVLKVRLVILGQFVKNVIIC